MTVTIVDQLGRRHVLRGLEGQSLVDVVLQNGSFEGEGKLPWVECGLGRAFSFAQQSPAVVGSRLSSRGASLGGRMGRRVVRLPYQAPFPSPAPVFVGPRTAGAGRVLGGCTQHGVGYVLCGLQAAAVQHATRASQLRSAPGSVQSSLLRCPCAVVCLSPEGRDKYEMHVKVRVSWIGLRFALDVRRRRGAAGAMQSGAKTCLQVLHGECCVMQCCPWATRAGSQLSRCPAAAKVWRDPRGGFPP